MHVCGRVVTLIEVTTHVRTELLRRYSDDELDNLLETGAITEHRHPTNVNVVWYMDHYRFTKTTGVTKTKGFEAKSSKEIQDPSELDFFDRALSNNLSLNASSLSVDSWMPMHQNTLALEADKDDKGKGKGKGKAKGEESGPDSFKDLYTQCVHL